MTEEQQKAIVDFVLQRIDKSALDRAVGFDVDRSPAAVFGLVEEARTRADGDSLECALMLANGRTSDIDLVPTLIELLRADWHTKHEDIALSLQKARDPRAIDALFETAQVQHRYLDHSPGVLARKCTWALADIGTPEAYERLRQLATSSDRSESTIGAKRHRVKDPRSAERKMQQGHSKIRSSKAQAVGSVLLIF